LALYTPLQCFNKKEISYVTLLIQDYQKKIFNIKMEVVGKYLGRGQELKDLFCTAVKIGNYGYYWLSWGDYSRHDSGGSGGDNSGSDSGGGSC